MGLASFSGELPEEISLLRLSNGTRCSLIPLMLGTHSLEQRIVPNNCQRRFVLSMPFEPSLCWDLHESSDANVLTYRSGLEIVQRSAAGASFNQGGHRAATLHRNAGKSAAESPPTVAFAVTLVDYQRD